MNKLAKTLLVVVSVLLLSEKSTAQDLVDIKPAPAFYIHANSIHQGTYQVNTPSFGLLYVDNFGRTKTIDLTVYDFKMSSLTHIELEKKSGTNEYTIDLLKVLGMVDKSVSYFFSMKDENGFEYKWSIQWVDLPVTELDVAIKVNPKLVSCGELEGNKVEFSGIVSNGKAPYSFSWFVLDQAKSKFMYQPKNDVLLDREEKSVVIVDKSPGYYVMLDVTDSCNGHARQMVYITCNNNKNKITTMFVEPLRQVAPGNKNKNQ